MSSKVIVPVADFAAFVTRLEQLERKLEERLVDGVYKYGPCLRCGYGPWDSSSAHEPRCCPRCHSAYWDRPPRKPSARRPEDPPLARWAKQRPPGTKRAVFVTPVESPVVEAPSPLPMPTLNRPAVVLPPELRPPGEPLIPPPPRVDVIDPPTYGYLKRSDSPVIKPNPEPAPTAHVAVLPDAIVEAVLAGQQVTYDDIKAAKDVQDEHPNDDLRQREGGPGDSQAPARPVDANLQAKKDAFFADAIAAGLVSSVAPVADEPATPETPFVTPADAPSLAPPADDDPFWK